MGFVKIFRLTLNVLVCLQRMNKANQSNLDSKEINYLKSSVFDSKARQKRVISSSVRNVQ